MNILNSVYKILLANCVLKACVVLLITAILCCTLHVLYKKLIKHFNQAVNSVTRAFIDALYKPLLIFIIIVGTTYSFEWLCWHWKLETQQLQLFRHLIFIASFAWFLCRFVTFYSTAFLNFKNKIADAALVYALGKIAKIAIIIVSGLSLLQLFGLSIAGVLAFGGMGGILIGLASKDLLANFFGSLMLFLDRPFVIGDQIKLPALNVEGQVQKIGWRLCRLLTPDCRPMYIPNALFSNLVVENLSRIKHRRFSCIINLRYQDIAKVPDILQSMQLLLKENTAIDKKCPINVNVSELHNSSLHISINAFTKLVNKADFLTFQQTLYLQLLDCIQSHDAKWAYPTSISFSAQE